MAEKHTLWPTSSEGSRALEDDPIRRLAAMAGGGRESVCEKRKFRAQKAFYFSSNFQRIQAAAQLTSTRERARHVCRRHHTAPGFAAAGMRD